jgi:microcystin-dependent protein
VVDLVIEHDVIPNQHLHEPIDVSTATAGQVRIADGLGSGDWDALPILTASSAFPVGTVMPFAGTEEPPGWAFCYGQLVGRSQYSSLFSTISTAYGIGDGATTFQLPDCRGRIQVGKDNMGGVAASRMTSANGLDGTILGTAGGSEGVVISANNIPPLTGTTSSDGSHTHTVNNGGNRIGTFSSGTVRSTGYTGSDAGVSSTYTMTVSSAGSHTHTLTVNSGSANSAHSNVQPTIVLNMIIYHGVGETA